MDTGNRDSFSMFFDGEEGQNLLNGLGITSDFKPADDIDHSQGFLDMEEIVPDIVGDVSFKEWIEEKEGKNFDPDKDLKDYASGSFPQYILEQIIYSADIGRIKISSDFPDFLKALTIAYTFNVIPNNKTAGQFMEFLKAKNMDPTVEEADKIKILTDYIKTTGRENPVDENIMAMVGRSSDSNEPEPIHHKIALDLRDDYFQQLDTILGNFGTTPSEDDLA